VGEGKKETLTFAMATASCRSAGARAGEERGVASAREARRGELERHSGWGSTRGDGARQEVARGGRKRQAAVLQRSRGRAEHVPEEEEEGRRSEGPRWKLQNLRDFTVNRIFPLIQSSNEEMVKIEVVELFKFYNFTLGLKFRNLKYTALFYTFALNSNLTKFLSLVM
jgi:hypothetical protein